MGKKLTKKSVEKSVSKFFSQKTGKKFEVTLGPELIKAMAQARNKKGN